MEFLLVQNQPKNGIYDLPIDIWTKWNSVCFKINLKGYIRSNFGWFGNTQKTVSPSGFPELREHFRTGIFVSVLLYSSPYNIDVVFEGFQGDSWYFSVQYWCGVWGVSGRLLILLGIILMWCSRSFREAPDGTIFDEVFEEFQGGSAQYWCGIRGVSGRLLISPPWCR